MRSMRHRLNCRNEIGNLLKMRGEIIICKCAMSGLSWCTCLETAKRRNFVVQNKALLRNISRASNQLVTIYRFRNQSRTPIRGADKKIA